MTQDPPNFSIFCKLMMMTTSSSDQEVLTAIRKANALLGRQNRNWEELLHSKVTMLSGSPFGDAAMPNPLGRTPSPRTPGSSIRHSDAAEINAYFETLLQGPRQIRTGFRDYVEDVYQWWQDKNFLTDKQYSVIKKAATNLR